MNTNQSATADMLTLVNASEAPMRHHLPQADAFDRAQLLALFDKLDERGKITTLAMLAVAVKLHPKGA